MVDSRHEMFSDLKDWICIVGLAISLCFGPTLLLSLIYMVLNVDGKDWYEVVFFLGVMAASPFLMLGVMSKLGSKWNKEDRNQELDQVFGSQP